MRGGAAGAGDGDVWQGGEVGQREAVCLENGSELAIGDAGVAGDGAGRGIDLNGFQVRGGELRVVGVGDVVEGMARADRLGALGSSSRVEGSARWVA